MKKAGSSSEHCFVKVGTAVFAQFLWFIGKKIPHSGNSWL
jgi:hypothetical protein